MTNFHHLNRIHIFVGQGAHGSIAACGLFAPDPVPTTESPTCQRCIDAEQEDTT